MLWMTTDLFQIRLCRNCGLRYPLVKDDSFGERCPACLGESMLLIEQRLTSDPMGKREALDPSINLRVILDNIRSAWNVGSIFRSADGFEFRHAYLCGITPTPENAEVRKTAIGAEQFVSWSAHKDAVELVNQLQKQDFEIWVLERTPKSVPIAKASFVKGRPVNKVLVVGNEITGVDPGVQEIADYIVHLPMRGHKSSFNVAVAFAVAAQIMHSRFSVE